MDTGAAFQMSLGVLIALVLVALAFDFMNGFHDAANSIATVVSTRVLKPYQAVMLAAACNFVALFVFHLSVATTVGRGIIDQGVVDHYLVFGALTGAIVWNLITWYYGIPSSSSHALIGGLVGSAVAKAGTWSLIPAGILKTVAFIFISPLVGLAFGAILMLAVSWIFVRTTPSRVDRWFRRMQLVSSSLYSLGHGGNDAQKTAGIIWMLLIAAGQLGTGDPIPYWAVVACYVTIAFGTAFGGWRIVKTMGTGITRLQPVGGFCAETAAATTIIGATFGGIPISTTHAITGAILGVGTTKGVRYVRWIWGQRIVMAWVLTIPCTAFIAAVTYGIVHFTVEPWMR